jgi:hypothetical protein
MAALTLRDRSYPEPLRSWVSIAETASTNGLRHRLPHNGFRSDVMIGRRFPALDVSTRFVKMDLRMAKPDCGWIVAHPQSGLAIRRFQWDLHN